MKLYQIEYLLAVGKYGSISKAADELLVSRPAVSRAIKDLEDEFEVTLLVRTTTGVLLTEAGQLMYEKCRKFEQLLLDLRTEINALKSVGDGDGKRQLNIGISFSARSRSAPLLSAFRQTHPDIFLRLTDLEGSFVDDATLIPDFDLEIALAEDRHYDGIGHLDIDKTGFVFCCSSSHPLAGRESVTIPEIGSEPLCGISVLEEKDNQVAMLFARHGLTPNFIYLTRQVLARQQMVREGICCCITPLHGIVPDPAIAAIPIADAPRFSLRIMWNESVQHNSAFFEFIDFAQRTLPQAGGAGPAIV